MFLIPLFVSLVIMAAGFSIEVEKAHAQMAQSKQVEP